MVFSYVGKNTGKEKKITVNQNAMGKIEELWSMTNMFTMCSRASTEKLLVQDNVKVSNS